MTELLVFYGLLSVAVIAGVSYSLHRYHKDGRHKHALSAASPRGDRDIHRAGTRAE